MRFLLQAGLAVWLAGWAHAAFVPDPARRDVNLPPGSNGPVRVDVNFFLLDVMSIHGAEERFTASIYLNYKWKDERMAFDAEAFGSKSVLYYGPAAEEQAQAMWWPALALINQVGDPQAEEKSLTINADGTVEFELRLIGEFSSPMDLRRFPNDSQRLQVQLESFLWGDSEMVLNRTSEKGHFAEGLSIRGWIFRSMETRVNSDRYQTGETYSRFTAEVSVQRESWFYIWSVIVPLSLVTFFACTCFFWDEETLSERVAQTLTCLLTVAAQGMVISDDMPKISYLTQIDYAFLLTYAVLLLVTVESIYVKYLLDHGDKKVRAIDGVCGWLVPCLYTAGMIAIFRFA